MNDKRRIVTELLAAGAITANSDHSTDDLIKAACDIADLIIEATPDEKRPPEPERSYPDR
jgi:hypothetical protein